MQLRNAPARAVLALLAAGVIAACKDQTPTVSGDQFFPGGSRPVTLETIIPASQFLQAIGSFTGYEGTPTFTESVVANQYQGTLNAHGLARFPVPGTVSFSQGGVSIDDSLFTITQAQLLVVIDTLGSRAAPTTLQAYRLLQTYEPITTTWTVASDTGGVLTPWTQPGGTRGPLVASATWTPHAAGDSLSLPVDTAQLRQIRADSVPLLFATAEAGTRVVLKSSLLRLTVHPSNATRDTTFTVDVNPVGRTFVFDPQPPAAGGFFQAGGIAGDRTLFTLNLNQQLPGCAPAQGPCPTVSIRDVRLNRVSLLLRPRVVPGGFDPLEAVPLELWVVNEPQLGRLAPLVPGRTTGGPILDSLRVSVLPTDTVVELPITNQTAQMAASDTLTGSFALIGEATGAAGTSTRTFGLERFDPQPRLRVVYTLPTRPTLP